MESTEARARIKANSGNSTPPHVLDTSIDTQQESTRVGQRAIPPLSASWRPAPLSEQERLKVQQILTACKDHDLEALGSLAASEGGLVEDQVRRVACELPTM
jgi:hypothetical protein